jgi:hypothetical protein
MKQVLILRGQVKVEYVPAQLIEAVQILVEVTRTSFIAVGVATNNNLSLPIISLII